MKHALYTIPAFAIIAMMSGQNPVAAAERQLESHEHGVSALSIAQENNTISFVLEAPGNDIVGFERAAENSEQIKAVNDALAHFKNPEAIFNLPSEANCQVSDKTAEYETSDDHAEFHITWTMTCSDIGKANKLSTRFFDIFERAVEIEVQAIGDTGQLAVEVDKGQSIIPLHQAIGS